MVNEEILEGLKRAITRGEPLEKAMSSFFNSGYKREDIEEAALAVSQFPTFSVPPQVSQQAPVPKPVFQSPVQNPVFKPLQQNPNFQPVQQVPNPAFQTIQQQKPVSPISPLPQTVVSNPQRVSSYPKKSIGLSKTVTILLFVLLFILLAILAALIIFKTQISNLLNNLFFRALF